MAALHQSLPLGCLDPHSGGRTVRWDHHLDFLSVLSCVWSPGAEARPGETGGIHVVYIRLFSYSGYVVRQRLGVPAAGKGVGCSARIGITLY